MSREANFSGILNETMAIVTDRIRDVAIFMLIIGGLSTAGIFGGLVSDEDALAKYGWVYSATTGLVGGLYALTLVVVSIVAGYFLLSQYLKGKGLLRDGPMRILPYVGMSLLFGLGLMVGFVLLIIPGFILLTRWSAATGYLIGARKGAVDSLSASWEATKGHGWSIFFAGLVMIVGLSILSGVVSGIVVLMVPTPVAASISAFVDAFTSAATSAFGIAVYSLVNEEGSQFEEVFA